MNNIRFRTYASRAALTFVIFILAGGFANGQQSLDFNLDDSLAPAGVDFPGLNQTWIHDNKVYFGCFIGTTPLVLYEVQLNEVSKGVLTVRELVSGAVPLKDFGFLYSTYKNGKYILWDPINFVLWAHVNVHFSHTLSRDGTLSLDYIDEIDGRKSRKRYRFKISGLTLMVIADQTDNNAAEYYNYTNMYFRPMQGVPSASPVTIPYMEEVSIIKAGTSGKEFFLSTFFDITLSGANMATKQVGPSSPGPGEYEFLNYPDYELSGGRKRSCLRDRFFITVTNPGVPDQIQPHFLTNRIKPSRFRDEVAERVYFDMWMGTPNSFVEARDLLDDLHDFGLYRLWISFQRWQYGGYGILETRFTPARAEFGGPVELEKTVSRAKHLGYRFGIRTAFSSLSTDSQNPYWNPDDVAFDKDGKMKYAAYMSIPEPRLSSLPDVRKKHYQREGTFISRDYDPNASFMDSFHLIAG